MDTQNPNYLKRRRADLKGRITKLRQAIDRDELVPGVVKPRFARLTELFHEFEELNIHLDELAADDEEVAINAQQFDEIQNNFYDLYAIVEQMCASINPQSTANNTAGPSSLINSTFAEKQKSVNLPIADLPKFDGNYDTWTSFKSEFHYLVGSRSDIDEVGKFLYLRNSLAEPVKKKLSLLDATAENYKVAWDTLTNLYEKKRFIVESHYEALIHLANPIPASAEALSRLIDDAQQHLATLKHLNMKPDEAMIVTCLQMSLPADVRKEWEKTLTSNILPTFADFYGFISNYSDHLLKEEKQATTRAGSSRKHSLDREARGSKNRKTNSGARSLVTSVAVECAHCKQEHRTYLCPDFAKLNPRQRFSSIKTDGACINCLRIHKDACKSTLCKKCGKPHHTLLHFDKSVCSNQNSNKQAPDLKNQALANSAKTT